MPPCSLIMAVCAAAAHHPWRIALCLRCEPGRYPGCGSEYHCSDPGVLRPFINPRMPCVSHTTALWFQSCSADTAYRLYRVDINSQLKAACRYDGVNLRRRACWAPSCKDCSLNLVRLAVSLRACSHSAIDASITALAYSKSCQFSRYAAIVSVLRAWCVGFSFLICSWM